MAKEMSRRNVIVMKYYAYSPRHEIILKTKGELTTAIALIKEFLVSDEAKAHDQDYLDKLSLIVEVQCYYFPSMS